MESKKKNKKKIAVVVGTRPNFVKVVCFLKELAKNKDAFDYTFIHTGQHYDYEMAKVFFEDLDIPKPDVNLEASGKSHIITIANIIREMQNFLSKNAFDFIVVFGDVNSTLAAAIASVKKKMKLVHVESGLRSHDRRMPEEINRVITDHISDILFVSEESGLENLKEEKIDGKKAHFVGNIMIDTLIEFSDKIDKRKTFEKLGLKGKDYIIVTIHRQENVDEEYSLKIIFKMLDSLSRFKKVVMPLHPRTSNKLDEFNLSDYRKSLTIIRPQGYLDFINLIKNSFAVITDSGGIQEETTFLKIPCITLRDSTERPVTVTKGTNRLVKIHDKDFEKQVMDFLKHTKHSENHINLWDGRTAERIIRVLKKY